MTAATTTNSLSLLQAIAYCIGDIVGSGIFVTPSGVLAQCDSPILSVVIWIVAAAISSCGALMYMEFATTALRSGGDFAFLTFVRWYPIATGFYIVGSLFTYPCILGIQILAVGDYLLEGIQAYSDVSFANPATENRVARLLGLVILFPIIFINFFSLRKTGGRFQIVVTSIKLAIVGLICVAGIVHFCSTGQAVAFDEAPFLGPKTTPGSVVLATYSALFSYTGYETLALGVEEVSRPKRTLPIATGIGMLVAVVVYAIMNVVYFTVLTVEEFKGTTTVAVLFLQKTIGSGVGNLVPFLVVAILIGSLNITVFGSSRYLYVGSRAGVLPSLFATLDERNKSPRVAVFAMLLFGTAASFLGNLNDLINYASYAVAMQQLCIVCAVFYMRYAGIGAEVDAFRAPIVVYVCYFFTCLALIVIPLLPADGNQQFMVGVYAIGMFICGLVCYFLLVRPKRLPEILSRIDRAILYACQVIFNVLPLSPDQ